MARLHFTTRRSISMLALGGLSLAALAGCAGVGSGDGVDPDVTALPAGTKVLAEYVAHVSPRRGSMTLERVSRAAPAPTARPGLSPQSFSELDIESDGNAGSGSSSTVELVTNTVGVDGECPEGFHTDTFCGNVTLNHFFDRSLSNTFVQVMAVGDVNGLPLSGHDGINGDESQFGLDGSRGLWGYTGTDSESAGVIGQSPSNSATRDWVFADPDGADTTIPLRVVSSLTYSSYTFAMSLRPFVDACSGAGAVDLGAPSAASAEQTLPFPFTIYGTTASTIRVYKRGVVTFGSTIWSPSAISVSLPDASSALPKPAIFPFWDDLEYGSGASTICVQSIGEAPNRRYVITWADMTFGASGAADGPAHLTFSAVLNEGSDQIDLNYNEMTGPTTRAIGASAAVAVQNETGTEASGAFQNLWFTTETAFSFIPQP